LTDLFDKLKALPPKFPGLDPLPTEAVYLMGCRGFNQFCCTLRGIIHPAKFCVFCVEELARQRRKPIFQGRFWGLYTNPFKHKATKNMWLLIPIKHIVLPSQIGVPETTELPRMFAESEKVCPSGGIMLRFGDPRQHVGTIAHLHINISEQNPGTEYRPPFAKNMSEHEEDYRRLGEYWSELAYAGGENWLFSPLGIQQTQPSPS
jgi:hypothetical protein